MVLYHIDGFGGTAINPIIDFFSKFADLYTDFGITKFLVFSITAVILYGLIMYITGKINASQLIKGLVVDTKNPILDNVAIRVILFLFIYSVALMPIPLVQLTPIVKENSTTKQITLEGYAISGRKTILDSDNKVAYLPAVVAVPLRAIERYVYSIPDFNIDDILVRDNSGIFKYLSSNLYIYNQDNPYDISKCVDSNSISDFEGFYEVDSLTNTDCYKPLPNYGLFKSNKEISGELFSDYFASVKKIHSILNSTISFLDNSFFKATKFELVENIETALKELNLDSNKVKKIENLSEEKNTALLKEKTDRILTKIEKNVFKANQIELAFQNDQLFSGFFRGYLNNLALDNRKEFIFLDRSINITDSNELEAFKNARNKVYNKYKADNLKRQTYYHAEIDSLDPADIVNDTNTFYTGVNPDFTYSYDSDKLVLNLNGITTNRTAVSSSELNSAIKATFLYNLKNIFNLVKFSKSDIKHYSVDQVNKILTNSSLSSTNKDLIKKVLEVSANNEAKYDYVLILDLIEDLVDKREKELNMFIKNYLQRYTENIERGEFTENIIIDKNAIVDKFKEDLLTRSKPVFGFLPDGYSFIKRDPIDPTKFIEDTATNAPIRLIKSVDYEEDIFYSKYLKADKTGYNFNDLFINKDFIDKSDFLEVINNLEETFTSDPADHKNLKKTLSLFNSAKDFESLVQQERQYRIFNGYLSGTKVFCLKKYNDITTQENFCKAINDRIDTITKNLPETDKWHFNLKNAISYLSAINLVDTLDQSDNPDYYTVEIQKLSNIKALLSGLLVVSEQSKFEDFKLEYNILKFGQDLLEYKDGTVLVSDSIINELNSQYQEDKDNEDLKQIMLNNYLNKTSFYAQNLTDTEKKEVIQNYLTKLDSANSLLDSATDLSTQLDNITAYIAYKTIMTSNSKLPIFLSKEGVSSNLIDQLYSGEIAKTDMFEPTIFNYTYDLMEGAVFEPLRRLQNVIIFRVSGSKLFRNQLLDTEIISGPVNALIYSEPEETNTDISNIDLKDSNNFNLLSFSSAEVIISTVVELIAIAVFVILSLYLATIIFLAILMNTIGLGYAIVIVNFLFLSKILVSGFDREVLPDFLQKNYSDIAFKSLKYLLAWVIFFLFSYVSLRIYYDVILAIQNFLVIEVFQYMAENGVNGASMTFLYGALIIIPLALYSAILYFMIKELLAFYSKTTIINTFDEIKDMKQKSINTLSKLINKS